MHNLVRPHFVFTGRLEDDLFTVQRRARGQPLSCPEKDEGTTSSRFAEGEEDKRVLIYRNPMEVGWVTSHLVDRYSDHTVPSMVTIMYVDISTNEESDSGRKVLQISV